MFISTNYYAVKNAIEVYGPISKPAIAKKINLSLPAVNRIVDILTEESIVSEHSIGESTGGRKPKLYVINESYAFICNVLIQGQKIKVQLLGRTRKEVKTLQTRIRNFHEEDILAALTAMIKSVIVGYENKLVVIGVGVPGLVVDNSIVKSIPTIPQWENYNLQKALSEEFPEVDILIENDVKLSAVGLLHKNETKGMKNIAYLYIGKGVGMGITIDGTLYKGNSSFAGEVGSTMSEQDFESKTSKYTFTNKIIALMRAISEDMDFEFIKKEISNPGQYHNEVNSLVHLASALIVNTFCFLDLEAIFLDGDIMNEALVKHLKSNLESTMGESYSNRLFLNQQDNIGMKGLGHYSLLHYLKQTHG